MRLPSIYCTDTQDRIPPEYFAQGKAVWCNGKPYLTFAAKQLGLKYDSVPPAKFATLEYNPPKASQAAPSSYQVPLSPVPPAPSMQRGKTQRLTRNLHRQTAQRAGMQGPQAPAPAVASQASILEKTLVTADDVPETPAQAPEHVSQASVETKMQTPAAATQTAVPQESNSELTMVSAGVPAEPFAQAPQQSTPSRAAPPTIPEAILARAAKAAFSQTPSLSESAPASRMKETVPAGRPGEQIAAELIAASQARSQAEAEAKAKEEAQARQRGAAEARARAKAEAQARAEAEAKAREEAQTRQREAAEARARARAQAKARIEAEAKARAEAEAKARTYAEAEVRAKAMAEAKAREEAQAREKAAAEARARAESWAKARAEAEAKARAQAEERARIEAEARARGEAESRAKAEAEARAREEAEARERAEAEVRLREEAEAQGVAELQAIEQIEAEARARIEAVAKARAEAQARAMARAEARAKAEAEARAQAEAAGKARAEAAGRARSEAEARAKAEAEARAREEAEARARAEVEAKAREEAEERERADAEAQAREVEEARARSEAEARAREEAEALERAEAEAKEHAEAEARARQEAEALERAETEARAQEEAEARERAEAEAKAQEEAEARERGEAEAKAQEEAEARERAEAELKAQEEAEARERAEADAKAQAEAEARQWEAAEGRARAEADAKARAEKARSAMPAAPGATDVASTVIASEHRQQVLEALQASGRPVSSDTELEPTALGPAALRHAAAMAELQRLQQETLDATLRSRSVEQEAGASSSSSGVKTAFEAPPSAREGAKAQQGDSLPPTQWTKLAGLEGLSEEQMLKLFDASARRVFKKGETICRAGDRGFTAFFLLSGTAEVSLPGVLSRGAGPGQSRRLAYIPIDGPVDLEWDSPLARVQAGELVGEMTCLANLPRSATLCASEDCVVLELLPQALLLLREHKPFNERMGKNYRERALRQHLRNLPVLRGLDEEFLAQLCEKAALLEFPAGTVVLKPGAGFDATYVIRAGVVKAGRREGNAERASAYLRRGESFGALAPLESGGPGASYKTMTLVSAARLTWQDIEAVLARPGPQVQGTPQGQPCEVCVDPRCLTDCPVGGIQRTPEGSLTFEESCIGCGTCAEKCPSGEILLEPAPEAGQNAPKKAKRKVRPKGGKDER